MHVQAYPDFCSLHDVQVPIMLAELFYLERRRQDRKISLAVEQSPAKHRRFSHAAVHSAAALSLGTCQAPVKLHLDIRHCTAVTYQLETLCPI